LLLLARRWANEKRPRRQDAKTKKQIRSALKARLEIFRIADPGIFKELILAPWCLGGLKESEEIRCESS